MAGSAEGEDDLRPQDENADPKAQDRLRDAHRPLDPWERYRALNDAYDLQQELIDLGDHKARFALIIMTGLNAVAFLMVARSDFLTTLSKSAQLGLGLYMGLYGALAVYFFFQAIESLRPRIYLGGADKELLGLRFFEGILTRDADDYSKTWSRVRIDQLSEEIAEQIHILSRINREKYRALRRLYLGLQMMTVMTAGVIGLLGAINLL
jgi:hypothetical protein